jgi:hypothetical protein
VATVAALSACTRFDATKVQDSTELGFRSVAVGDGALRTSEPSRLAARAQTLLGERFGAGAASQVKAGTGLSPSLVVADPEIAAFLTNALPVHVAVKLGVERRLRGVDEKDVELLHLQGGSPARGVDDSCPSAGDGECDEPSPCEPGTDLSDCGRPLYVMRASIVDEKDLTSIRTSDPQTPLLVFADEVRRVWIGSPASPGLAVIYVDRTALSACPIPVRVGWNYSFRRRMTRHAPERLR